MLSLNWRLYLYKYKTSDLFILKIDVYWMIRSQWTRVSSKPLISLCLLSVSWKNECCGMILTTSTSTRSTWREIKISRIRLVFLLGMFYRFSTIFKTFLLKAKRKNIKIPCRQLRISAICKNADFAKAQDKISRIHVTPIKRKSRRKRKNLK